MEVEVGTDCLAGKEKQLSIIIDNLFYHLRFFFFASHVVAFSIYESVNPHSHNSPTNCSLYIYVHGRQAPLCPSSLLADGSSLVPV